MPAETDLPGGPEAWLRYAVSDLRFARVAASDEIMREGLCFHAQQAAEKAIKAVLIAKGITPPKTHSIGLLLDLVSEVIHVPNKIQEAASLTDYAVTTRYPGDAEPITQTEYQQAVSLAETVVDW